MEHLRQRRPFGTDAAAVGRCGGTPFDAQDLSIGRLHPQAATHAAIRTDRFAATCAMIDGAHAVRKSTLTSQLCRGMNFTSGNSVRARSSHGTSLSVSTPARALGPEAPPVK